MSQWTCRETSQLREIRACVERGTMHETWHLQDALTEPEHPDRWWYAASDQNGRVGAFAAIEGTRACLFGDNEDAVEAMARALLRSQQLHTSRESHRHVLYGPARVVSPLWRIFQDVGRQVVADRRPTLMASRPGGKGSRRMSLDIATSSDQKTCVAFLADRSVEMDGVDPRKVAPQRFEREIATAIAAGDLLVGREVSANNPGGRAMFVGEMRGLSDDVAMLNPWHVPGPIRGRKILVAGALLGATTTGPGADKTIWVLVDGDTLRLAADRAGYEPLVAWREIAMLG